VVTTAFPVCFVGVGLAAGSGTLGSFKRVNADIIRLDIDFLMGCKVAQTISPFGSRVRVGAAHFTDRTFDDTIAALTFFNNDLAAAAFGGATSFFPESTLGTSENSLALHVSIPPSFMLWFRFRTPTNSEFPSMSQRFFLPYVRLT
jgi:hypothetical protein